MIAQQLRTAFTKSAKESKSGYVELPRGQLLMAIVKPSTKPDCDQARQELLAACQRGTGAIVAPVALVLRACAEDLSPAPDPDAASSGAADKKPTKKASRK